MPFSPSTYEEKPYNRCIDCIHIGKTCDGPDFLAMTIPRLCEWARLRKSYLGSQDKKWTNAYIADQAEVSKATVDRFFAGDIDDIKFTTASRIIRILVNGTWGQYPCTMAAGETNDFECERLKELLNEEKKKTAHLVKRVEFQEEQMLAKDEIIADRKNFLHLKDRTIQILAVLLGVSVIIIIAFLVTDFLNPSLGFFWKH